MWHVPHLWSLVQCPKSQVCCKYRTLDLGPETLDPSLWDVPHYFDQFLVAKNVNWLNAQLGASLTEHFPALPKTKGRPNGQPLETGNEMFLELSVRCGYGFLCRVGHTLSGDNTDT